MLYTLGDSYTYGFNFSDENERLTVTWPNVLASKLNCDFVNLSAPGGSNWRSARIINNGNFTKDDYVVLALTSPERFELGVNENHKPPKIYPGRIGDLLEHDGKLITKRFFPQLIERSTDKEAVEIASRLYSKFYNSLWFDQYTQMMINSCVYKFMQSGCKWIIFNTWCNLTLNENYPANFIHKETNLNDIILGSDALEKYHYWTPDQHKIVADIVFESFNKIYG